MRYDEARKKKKIQETKEKAKKIERECYRNVHIGRKYENRKIKNTSNQERKGK